MIKNILWDFDGVILDSMKVRDWGFEKIFETFPEVQVKELLRYHNENGGLSRYVKIRYFFEEVLKESISDNQVLEYAGEFSKLMKSELINPKNLINDSLNFIKSNHKKFNFHIVSGSDQDELRFLCKELKIASLFQSINGSPTPKTKLVQDLLEKEFYKENETCLIGDSINDYEAAINNDIKFYGYNNVFLKTIEDNYINTFSDFKF